MIASPQFARAIGIALAAVRDRVRERLLAELPPDVAVIAGDDGVMVEGAALGRRALADARLRDLAGLLR